MPAPSLFAESNAVPTPSSTPAVGDSNGAVTTPVSTESNVPAAITPTIDSNAPSANSGMGSPGQNPPASDPNSLIPPPVEPEQPSPVNNSGNEEKQRQEQKTRYYTAKTKADQDEVLANLLAKADKAKSDESKRETLREYYDLLAKRMKKIDPSISEWIDTMHAAYLRRLAQVRIEPSVPLAPPPLPVSDTSPAPEKKKKIKKTDEEVDAAPSPSPRKSKKKAVEADPSPSPASAASKKSQ